MDAEQHYHERMREFERETVEPDGIVMLGSSHVEWFDAALLPEWRIINRGIAGDRLDAGARGVLHRLEVSVFACRPGAVVFESGSNDLGELLRFGRPTIEEITCLYDQAVGEIRARLAVPVLLVSVFPTRGSYAGMAPLVPEFNERVEEIAGRFGCDYQDVYSLLIDSNGELAERFTEDGLHLNPDGYQMWASELERWLIGCRQVSA